MVMHKKIIILVNGPKTLANLDNLIHALEEKDASIEISTGLISNVFFQINGDSTHVVESVSGQDISSFDLVVFRAVSRRFAEEALAISIYCDYHHVKYIDSCVSQSIHKANKLASMMALWAKGIPVPPTMYGPVEQLAGAIKNIGFPAIFKATAATHGTFNYKITSVKEIGEITASEPDKQFLLQKFIENQGDYRILVVNGTGVNVEFRRGNGLTHVNNESAGGTSTLVRDLSGLGYTIDIARKSAKIIGLEVAGVDIIIDKDNNPFVIEVNRAPQLTSQQEFAAWADGILEIING